MTKKTLVLFFLLAVTFVSFKKTADWYLLETKTYRIQFPQKPTASTREINSDIGKLILNLNIYEVPETEKDDNHLYLFNETAYPDSLVNSDKTDVLDEFFKKAVAGAVKNVNGKLLSEKNIAINHYPGREVRIDFQDGQAVIKMRVYLVKNIMIMLEVISDAKNESNPSSDKFLNSFELKI